MTSWYVALGTWLHARADDPERGASLVEYALLVALIAVVCVLAVQVLGETTSTSMSSAASHVANAN